MSTRVHPLRLVALAVAVALFVPACTTTKETPVSSTSTGSSAVPTTQAESAAQLRADIDRLVAAVGPVVTVQRDQALPCDPGNASAGYAWTYGAVLRVAPDAQSAAMDAAAQAMTERGYRVGRSPRTDEVDLTFRRAGFDLDLSFFAGKDQATVGGSGPCLKEKE